MLRKIISGGQTGADRAGLDFAIETGLEHGGYVPRGRKAEDGENRRGCLGRSISPLPREWAGARGTASAGGSSLRSGWAGSLSMPSTRPSAQAGPGSENAGEGVLTRYLVPKLRKLNFTGSADAIQMALIELAHDLLLPKLISGTVDMMVSVWAELLLHPHALVLRPGASRRRQAQAPSGYAI
jgi:hypothetical protein